MVLRFVFSRGIAPDENAALRFYHYWITLTIYDNPSAETGFMTKSVGGV